ncbi:MAG: 6-phospho-beta-glucosidase, partial [Omnitrophica WOR_2 bacterium]
MTHLKIAVIGAGSSYTPEIIEGFCQKRDSLPVDEIVLMDINPERLHVVAAFCQRYINHLGCSIPLQVTMDRRQAIEGASFILTQIRVGGNSQRILDEKIPLRYGVIGQETTGPGGMLKALRTIPPMLELAHDVEEINPQAWIINYTNPTGIITEAVSRYSRAQIVGLCAGAYFPRNAVVKALGVAPGSV